MRNKSCVVSPYEIIRQTPSIMKPITATQFAFTSGQFRRSSLGTVGEILRVPVGHSQNVDWPAKNCSKFQIAEETNFVISTLPADGLAPLGARTSATMVVITFIGSGPV